ncbi:hypothetical protein ACO0LG_20140 [Undibacterium sp. Ji42W]|uniref:hypothetical protein n=1 Tax=Undibacterium sp. Ji42W TaxID=3413039 RepID=UPI003BF32F92
MSNSVQQLSFFITCLCLSATVSAEPASASAPARQWVSGSYVNVRTAAKKDAPVSATLIINTEVKLLVARDDFCEISWENNQHGFIACKFLSTTPVILAELTSKKLANGAIDPSLSARAFWLQPGYNSLLAVASYFENTMLPEKQRESERKYLESGGVGNPEIKRFPIPELNAMRAKLAAGVVAPKEMAELASIWDGSPARMLPSSALHQWVYRQIRLTKVQSSFFKSVNEFASPKTTPESISAQFGISWKLAVTAPPAWGGDNNGPSNKNGIWDMGEISQRLDQPIYTVGMNEKTEIVQASSTIEYREIPGGDSSPCAGNPHILWPVTDPQNAAHIQGLFRSNKALNLSKAKSTVKLQVLLQPKSLPADPHFVRALTRYIDLDGDGIPDLALWDGINTQVGLGDNSEYHLTLIFVNVLGRWHFLDFDEEDPPCGC